MTSTKRQDGRGARGALRGGAKGKYAREKPKN